MTRDEISPLGYALLSLIGSAARSGYALRKVFETTPLGFYSSSPGSIYPALKKLQALGYVRSETTDRRGGMFHLTRSGLAELRRWLASPVTDEAFSKGPDVFLLRFALLREQASANEIAAFLTGFEGAAARQIVRLDDFLASDAGRAMSLHSRLAVVHGLEQARTSAAWAVRTREALERESLQKGAGR